MKNKKVFFPKVLNVYDRFVGSWAIEAKNAVEAVEKASGKKVVSSFVMENVIAYKTEDGRIWAVW